MNKLKNIVILSLISLFVWAWAVPLLHAQGKYTGLPKLTVFFSPSCYHCLKVKNEFMPRIETKYKGVIDIEHLNLDELDNYKLLLSLQEKYAAGKMNLPILYMQGRFLDEEVRTYNQIERFIELSLGRAVEEPDKFGEMDLLAVFKSLTLWTIVVSGFIDGINPCAFTVIVFFIAFLTTQKYRRREVASVGIAFIFSVFITYLLLGLGALRVLYAFKGIYIVKQIVYGLSAMLCFVLFCLSIIDILKFRKTGNTDQIILRIPDRVKAMIQRLIGKYYRKNKDAEKHESKGIVWLSLSAFGCGFFVSFLEAVCTGQLYLPTIAFVLKSTDLKAQAFLYLLIYNIMFIIPLLAIFVFALLGTSSGQFAHLLRKHMVLTKALLAAVFLGLGILLLVGI